MLSRVIAKNVGDVFFLRHSVQWMLLHVDQVRRKRHNVQTQ